MKFVAIIALTCVLFQIAFAADRSQELESSLSSILQSAAQSAAAQSAAALNVAASESAAAAQSVQSSFPATKLESSGATTSSESSGCRTWGCGNAANDGLSVKDAVQPIEDWIKDFKHRTGGSNDGDMMAAAKMVIKPLIKKLKRSQRDAIEKLEESDSEIVRRVEEQATEHVYTLLRAENISAKKQDAADARKEKIAEVKAEAADKEKEAKMVAEHSESSKKK